MNYQQTYMIHTRYSSNHEKGLGIGKDEKKYMKRKKYNKILFHFQNDQSLNLSQDVHDEIKCLHCVPVQ